MFTQHGIDSNGYLLSIYSGKIEANGSSGSLETSINEISLSSFTDSI